MQCIMNLLNEIVFLKETSRRVIILCSFSMSLFDKLLSSRFKITYSIYFLSDPVTIRYFLQCLFPPRIPQLTLLADGDQTQSTMRVKHSFMERFRGFAQIGPGPIA